MFKKIIGAVQGVFQKRPEKGEAKPDVQAYLDYLTKMRSTFEKAMEQGDQDKAKWLCEVADRIFQVSSQIYGAESGEELPDQERVLANGLACIETALKELEQKFTKAELVKFRLIMPFDYSQVEEHHEERLERYYQELLDLERDILPDNEKALPTGALRTVKARDPLNAARRLYQALTVDQRQLQSIYHDIQQNGAKRGRRYYGSSSADAQVIALSMVDAYHRKYPSEESRAREREFAEAMSGSQNSTQGSTMREDERRGEVTLLDDLGISIEEIVSLDDKQAEDLLKKRYRKMALMFHPDVNKDPQAEGIFRRATVSYQTLKNPEKRRKYLS